MKIELIAINAKYIHSNLAVYSLRAYAKEYVSQIEIGEFTINHQIDDILMEIYKRKPDVLCFSCYIWNIHYVEELIREYHKLCPNVPIWLGGPEVSFETSIFLERHPEVTGIMIGEGEETFRELCSYYIEEKTCVQTLDEIKGIAYRSLEEQDNFYRDTQQVEDNQKSGAAKILTTVPREPLDMRKLSFCYENLVDFSNRIIYYESSRGCPFACSYCLSSVDKQLRFRDIAQVKEELSFFIEQKVPQVKFVDRTFNCNHSHAMEIWRFIKEHDNGMTNFHFEISADLLKEEELQLFSEMRPGLIQLEIGVQSTNEETVKEIKRTMCLERLKETVKTIQGFQNIHQHLDLIAGLPYEDYTTFQKSFNDVYALQPEQLQLGFLKVLKGSYMYEHAAAYEICYHTSPPYEVLSTKWLSFDEMIRLKRVEEVLEVYYNSRQFEMSIRVLQTCFASAFLMYEKLGDFYEENGYFGMSHSRIRRCEILLAFVASLKERGEVSQCVWDCIKEALVFDLYYRENCKSRPSWALDRSKWKAVTRFYCKNGKLSHVEPFHYDFLQMTDQLPVYTEEENWVFFSYEKRNLLTHQAEVKKIYPKEDMEAEDRER